MRPLFVWTTIVLSVRYPGFEVRSRRKPTGLQKSKKTKKKKMDDAMLSIFSARACLPKTFPCCDSGLACTRWGHECGAGYPWAEVTLPTQIIRNAVSIRAMEIPMAMGQTQPKNGDAEPH